MSFAKIALGIAMLTVTLFVAVAQQGKAQKEEYTQVFWLKGKAHKFIFPSYYCPMADRGPERDLFNKLYDSMKGRG